jgi:predicted permease
MSATLRFVIFQIMIIVPFLSGTLFRSKIPYSHQFTKKIIRINLILIEPVIALWSIWGLGLSRDMILLPISGLILVVIGLASGWVFVPALGLREKKRTSFLISSSLANHGFTMGAFLCYLFWGERGLGLAFIFLSYFMLYIFTVIFPYAQMVSTSQRYSLSFIKNFLLNMQNMPLAAIIAGLMLQAVGLERPRIYFPIDILIIISIAVYYFALGINFTTSDIVSSLRENIALCIIKFLIVPFFAFAILCSVSLDPHVEAVILIQSFMPAAIYSVVASVLFGLDTRLSSNLFVLNSIFFLVMVLPLLFIFRGYIFGGMM